MKVRLFAAAAGLALSFAAALPAHAQFAKPSDAIKYRQAAMRLMSTHFGRVAAMANGKAPYDPKVAGENADLFAMLAKLPFDAFGPGTDKGGDTDAKPEIWKEADHFKKHTDELLDAAAKLPAAARSGDLAQLKAATGAVGKTCKACHDHFKND
ncbi:MAG: cytochrome c [Pelomonas sp.]|nr:cytochrome c [Roseateles sp.]